jgi:hypothetical protein
MTQTDVETLPFGEVAQAPRRFACPACGSALRTGAILCPHCGVDLWAFAHGGPAPSADADADSLEDGQLAVPTSADKRTATRSFVLGAIALGVKLVVSLISAASGSLMLWIVMAWATTLMALYAIYLAWQAPGRTGGTRDERGLMLAKYGLVLGMASVAYVVSMAITSLIDQVIGNL